MAALLLAARYVLAATGSHDGETRGGGGEWLEEGGVLVADGRIRRVLRSPAARARAARTAGTRTVELGEVALVPGLVNAHAHLELGGLHGRVPARGGFAAWVRRLVRLRASLGRADLARAARAGARRCVETGTTAVGDVDSAGGSLAGLRAPPLLVRQYRELLDGGDPARTRAALARARRPLAAHPRRAEGLSPHAPFTASDELLRAAAGLARARALPVSVHWSETPEELEWLRAGTGPLAGLVGASPRVSGLERLARAGLLEGVLSLVHGNHPRRGEPARLAAAGAVLVHCPGSHAFFGREKAPLGAYLRAGVTVALGTDSLASNDDLDLFREMRLVRTSHPELAPVTVWNMATRGGAAALGWRGALGELRPGARADLVALACDARPVRGLFEELTTGALEPCDSWIGGRRSRPFSARSAGRERAARAGRGYRL